MKRPNFSFPWSEVRWPTAQFWYSWLPSRGNVLFTLLVVGLIFSGQAASVFPMDLQSVEPSSPLIPYQGRLADASGTPLDGTHPMIFRVYKEAQGGTPLWSEQRTGPNSVPVSDGLFNVMLGDLTEIPSELFIEQNSLWLGITVGTDDEMSPRVQMPPDPWVGSVFEKLDRASGSTCLQEFKTVTLPGNYEREEVPDLSLEFTLDRPAKVLLWSDGVLRFNTGGDNQFYLYINDSKIRSYLVMSSGVWTNVQNQHIVALPSGTYRLHAQVGSLVEGTATVRGGDSYSTCISYAVLSEQ